MSKALKKILICFISITFITISATLSQELHAPVTKTQAWLNIGMGDGRIKNILGSSVFMSFSYAQSNHVFTGRYISYEKNNEAVYAINIPFTDIRLEEAKEISIIYGRMEKQQFGFASIGIGLGVIEIYENLFYLKKKYRELGIALETQAFFTLPGMGLGFYGYGNINRETIFYGVLVSLQIGKLR
jgi:hypothetical protein